MILIMPLAGKGSRFLAQGYTTPKPLIEIKGKPMIQWAFDAIKDFQYDTLLFILRKEQEEEPGIATALQKIYPNSRIVLQNGFLNGAVLSVLEAREQINTEEAIAIYNPDQYFSGPSAIDINNHFNEGVAGLIPVFYATHPKWSFAQVGDDGYVSRVAEKEPISTNATVGMYIFKHGKDFVWGGDNKKKKKKKMEKQKYSFV